MWTAGEIYRTVDHISANKKFFFKGKKKWRWKVYIKTKLIVTKLKTFQPFLKYGSYIALDSNKQQIKNIRNLLGKCEY